MNRHISENMQLVLQHHPRLSLTAWQSELVSSCRGRSYGWQNRLARRRNTSRQSVTNVLRAAQRKIEAARDFSDLSRGAIVLVFKKYSTGWATTPVRRLLWDALRPIHDRRPSLVLQKMLLPIQEELVRETLRVFSRTLARKHRGERIDGQELALAYNMLITAAHIESRNPAITKLLSEFDRQTHRRSWIVHRFIRRALHLFDHQACEAHRHWLREKIARSDAEGKRFTTYALLYYGGAGDDVALRFLESDGRAEIRAYSYVPVLARLYTNMQIPRYDSPLWDNINFLRLVLLAKHFPLTLAALPPGSRNSVRVLCQQALRSTDSLVAEYAERLLPGLNTHAA